MADEREQRKRMRGGRRRAGSWNGPLPILAAVCIVWLAALGWRRGVEPAMLPPLELFDPVPQRFLDVEGARAPLYLNGWARSEGLLIVGDSRALADISLRALQRDGVRPVALLWNGLAQLDHLIEGARSLPTRRLLVCLSPASVHDRPRPNMTELLGRERAKTITTRIDEQLGRALSDLRRRFVRPVHPGLFSGGRFGEAPDPDRQVRIYSSLLSEPTRAARSKALWSLRRDLEALQAEGWRIACVRLPVSPRMRAVEDAAFPPRNFTKLCEGLGIPFLDAQDPSYATFDGSHLMAADAERLSAVLARWLLGLPGFLGT